MDLLVLHLFRYVGREEPRGQPGIFRFFYYKGGRKLSGEAVESLCRCAVIEAAYGLGGYAQGVYMGKTCTRAAHGPDYLIYIDRLERTVPLPDAHGGNLYLLSCSSTGRLQF